MKTMDAKILALYLGCKIRFTADLGFYNDKLTLCGIDEDSETPVICLLEGKYRRVFNLSEVKLLLRPLSSMTEEDFRLFAEDFFKSKNLVFASQDKYWYACDRELDPDYEGTPMEYINDAGDDDPENVLMCSAISKLITYGWITYEELYHGFSMKEQANVIRYFISQGFDLFNLIESGQAIDSTNP